MSKQDIRILFIFFRILPELDTAGIPFEYCSHVNQLADLINENKQYRIIVVCKAEDLGRLHSIITSRDIGEIFTLGPFEEHQITNKEIISVDGAEHDLIFEILYATIRYAHREELVQRHEGNYGLANRLALDAIGLLEEVEGFS